MLVELLDNQEGLFDSEDDDVSTTNDYSSINEQVLPISFCTNCVSFFFYLSICPFHIFQLCQCVNGGMMEMIVFSTQIKNLFKLIPVS